MTSGTVHISMWSGPRNISTAMMRSFENRPDTEVVDEPFYARWLTSSGIHHPYRDETLSAYPTGFDDVVSWVNTPASPPATIRFHKHIAFHIDNNTPLDWLSAHRGFALIRDPASMAASYARKFEDLTPIVESYRIVRRVAHHYAHENRAFPIVSSEDILADPENILTKLCEALGIPFLPQMLNWPAGPRKSDGPWGPHWYDAVNKSTGFTAPTDDAPRAKMPAHAAAAAKACQQDYDFLRAQRLR